MSKRNENRPGYKETKVGWIPINWKAVKFKDACRTIMDGTHFSPKSKSGVYRYITSRNIRYGYFDLSQCSYISEEEHDFIYKRCPVKKGDVLLTKDGAQTGNACINILDEQFSLLSSVAVLDGKKDILKNDYLLHWVLSPYGQFRIKSEMVGQAITRLTLQTIESLSLPLPPLPEQKKVAEILSTWDAAIEQTRNLIDVKKRRKKGLMQQLPTGKKRLPGFSKTKDRNSYRFFDLPTDWKCPRIREVAEESSERNRQRDKLTVLSCSKHFGFVESSEYFGKQIFSENTSNYKVIRRGCFGYPSNHIEEGSIGLFLNHDIGMVSPIYTVFKCNENVVPEFLFALFKNDTYRHIFSISTNASVDRRGSLRWREFSLIQVPNPSKEEQHAIVDVLQAADNEINQLEKKLKALEKQKRGLMQKLLTGEIRVIV